MSPTIRRLAIVAVALAFVGIIALAIRDRQQRAALSKPTHDKLLIVTSTFPLYDFTRAVAADATNVIVAPILPFNVGPHDFSPTPSTTELVGRADVVIKNGLGLDTFADELIEASGNDTVLIVDSSQGLTTFASEDEPGATDPHVWLDPANAIIMVNNIRDGLIAHDPANRTAFEQGAAQYVASLEELKTTYATALQPIAVSDRRFVAFHDAFHYFARAFNLTQVASFEPAPGQEPSAKELATIIAVIRDNKIKALFAEPQFSPKIVEAVASDLDLQIHTLDPIETATETDSYLAIMQRNLQSLMAAFK